MDEMSRSVGMRGCSNKPFDFGAAQDRDSDPGILTEFLLPLRVCKNFAGSPDASTEAFTLRELVVLL